MNRQWPPSGIEWTRVLDQVDAESLAAGIRKIVPRAGFTANPVRGCKHECQWRIGGKIVECYAKSVSRKFKQHYPNGFESLSFHPEALDKIRREKKPAGIFIDSMSDLFGVSVEHDWIEQTLKCVRECPQHIFQSLTKNPSGLLRWSPFPDNMWVGISAPPTFMYGHEMTPEQQHAWFRKGLEKLSEVKASVKWASLEPLSFDMSGLLAEFGKCLNWAVIGAGSDGHNKYQPKQEDFAAAYKVLRANGTRIFLKGNIDIGLATEVCGQWLEEFPVNL